MLSYLIDRYFIKQPKFRGAFTRLVYGRDNRQVTLLGSDLTINTASENGYWLASKAARRRALFRDEATVLINLAGLTESSMTFLDVGANIGLFSAALSRFSAVKKDFRVIAFEVDPNTYERLAANAKVNGFEARNLGISDKEEEIEFIRGAVSHVTMAVEHRNAYSIEGATFRTKCLPLGSMDIPGNSIMLKIDVEGHEYEVLNGALPLFNAGRVSVVYLDGFEKRNEVFSFLRQHNFSLYEGRTLRPATEDVFSLLAVRTR